MAIQQLLLLTFDVFVVVDLLFFFRMKSMTPKTIGLLPRNFSILSIDRIGITAYINDFYSKYSKLLFGHEPKEYKDYVQGRMRYLAKENGLVIKQSKFKKSDRNEFRENPPDEDKLLGIYGGYEYHYVLDKETWKTKRKCVRTYYVIVWDKEYGLISFRICSWVPMLSYVYFNAHDYLRCYCDENEIEYERFKNSFERIGLTKKELKKILIKATRLSKLGKMAGKWFKVLIPRLADYYQFSYSQMEFSIDQFIGERDLLRRSIEKLILRNLPAFQGSKIFTVLDRDRVIVKRKGKEFVPKLINDRVMLLNYNASGLQIKIYPKGKQIRFELTYNKSYMRKIGRRKYGPDIKKISELYDHAANSMNRIFEVLKRVRVKSRYDFTDDIVQSSFILKGSDLKFFQAITSLGVQDFQNKDLQKLTGMSRNQIYYRLKRKFAGYFNITGRIWTTTGMGWKLLNHSLEFYGKAIGLWHRFLHRWKGITVGLRST